MQNSQEYSRPAYVSMLPGGRMEFPKDDKLEAWRAEQLRKNVTRVVRRIRKEDT